MWVIYPTKAAPRYKIAIIHSYEKNYHDAKRYRSLLEKELTATVSIAPIPIATMSNREWGSIGTNYLKGLFALAFQGFLIMV